MEYREKTCFETEFSRHLTLLCLHSLGYHQSAHHNTRETIVVKCPDQLDKHHMAKHILFRNLQNRTKLLTMSSTGRGSLNELPSPRDGGNKPITSGAMATSW